MIQQNLDQAKSEAFAGRMLVLMAIGAIIGGDNPPVKKLRIGVL